MFSCVHQGNRRITPAPSNLTKYAQKTLWTKTPLSRGMTGKTFPDTEKNIKNNKKTHEMKPRFHFISYQNGKPQLNINCLYMNARSIVNKIDELQVLATNMDVLAFTETWLTPDINSCEILPNMNFTIERRDRFDHNNKRG